MDEQLQNLRFMTTVVVYQSNYIYVYHFESDSEKLAHELLTKLESNYGIPTCDKNDNGTILGYLVNFESTRHRWFNIHKYIFKLDLLFNRSIERVKQVFKKLSNL